jgi:hypothetical protein
VLTRGATLARWLGIDRLRVNVMPIVAGPPWGIAPALLPTWPLPTKVTARVCEPLDWSHLGPEAADDPEQVRCCYEEILGVMQTNLDELVEELPNPVAARLTTALGLDRLIRGTAGGGAGPHETRRRPLTILRCRRDGLSPAQRALRVDGSPGCRYCFGFGSGCWSAT